MSIRAVLFDLDNTLTHRDLSVQRYAAYLAARYAAVLSEPQIDNITEIVRRIDNGGYPKKAYLTHPSIAASVAAALLSELNWIHTPSLEELTEFWFEKFGQCAVAMPDVEQVLQQLVAEGYKLAIISNGGHETRLNIVQGLGIQDYFEQVVSSGSFGISKPNPEIFQYTVSQLGLKPEQCVYIGDHPINDIEGAKNAGLHHIWLQGFHDVQHSIQPSVQYLTEIFEILEQINARF